MFPVVVVSVVRCGYCRYGLTFVLFLLDLSDVHGQSLRTRLYPIFGHRLVAV